MKTNWLVRNNGSKLILYFAGWGMNGSEVSHLDASGFDVLCVYDYRDLDQLPEIDGEYREYYVVSWSFGVACTEYVFCRLNLPIPVKSIAVNGTLKPVDSRFGIPPEVFQGTLDSYSLENREKFLRRTCGSKANLQFFMQQADLRNVDEQREELAKLGTFFRSMSEQVNIFEKAIIGTKDRIIPAVNQTNFWDMTDTKAVEVAGVAHYPFHLWKSWQEIIEL